MSEAFEQDAARFYHETGLMAPGKDEAAATGQSLENRQRAWHDWCLREAEHRIDEVIADE